MRRAASTGSITSSTGTGRPSSIASEVAPTPWIPHAVICWYADMSGSQLSEKPCIDTPRETRTPIEAIFRSGRCRSAGNQAPERPSTCTAPTPNPAQTSTSTCSSRRT